MASPLDAATTICHISRFIGRIMNRHLTSVFALCFLATSCSQAAQPAAVHIPMTNGNSEHDEVVYPSGDVADIYPDKVTPHEVVVHKANGGKIDVICLNGN